MTCYITPAVYPDYVLDTSYLESRLINHCLQNNYSIHDFADDYILKGWYVAAENNYLKLVIASDAASVEFNSSSNLLLAEFSLLIWTEYPVATDIHLVTGDLSKSYLLQKDVSFEQIKAFLTY